MPATALAVPPLSQIQAWSTDHLESAATQWECTADTWEHAFIAIHRETPTPGGTPWTGARADAAVMRTGTDRLVAVGAGDSLYAAVSAARYGAGEISGARQLALQAVAEAQAAGFDVREDLSVISRQPVPAALQAAMQAQAQAHAANIRSQAAALLAVDQQVAGDVSAAIAGVSSAQFDDTPIAPEDPEHKKDPTIQLVDNHTKQDPLGGFSDEQKRQVAAEIAAGHAYGKHADDFPGMSEDDIAMWIYNTMNDPTTLRRTSENGFLALYRDGVVVYVDPKNPDYGTVFRPTPLPNSPWRDPFDYFVRHTREGLPDALPPPPPAGPPPLQAGVGPPPAPTASSPAPAPPAPAPSSAFPGWGTHISPQKGRDAGGEIGNLQRFIDAFSPPDPNDPNSHA